MNLLIKKNEPTGLKNSKGGDVGGKDTESSGKGGDINLINKSELILTLNNVLDIKKIR